MRGVVLLILIASAVQVSAEEAAAPPVRTIYNDSDYSAIKGMPLSLVIPEHYRAAGDGKSFRHESVNSAIEVTRLEAAYADVIKVFTAEEMATRGLRLLSKDNVTADNRASLLLHVVENTADASIYRWTLVIGDYKETYMVNGTYPKELEGELSAPLRGAVMSTRWNKHDTVDPFANFRFTVVPTPKLTYTADKDLKTLVVYTSDGIFPLQGPGDPLFIVGYEMNEEKITDERAFAKQALLKVPHCTGVVPKETTAITLGGLQGYESTADAKDETSGTPFKVYQTMLFADGYHVFLLGIVDVPRSEEFLPEFKATARTFKMK